MQAAENNRFYTLPVKAPRGVLLSRYQEPLVKNERIYQLLETPDSLYSETTQLSQAEALQLLATDSGKVKLEYQRDYPWGEALAHILGYLGVVTADDLEEDSSLRAYHEVGRFGLERMLDRRLRGADGAIVYEIDARLRRQRMVSEKPAQSGENVATTLDPYLSQVAYQALGSQRGSVIISDTATGDVLALVNTPTFDPELLSQPGADDVNERLRRQQVQALFSDEHKPFFNRAVSGEYPPGSVFKLVTALAGLETDAFTTSTTVVDEGVLKVGEFEYGNWYFRQFGRTEGEIGLVRAIARSNDIFFYKAAEWTGPDKLAEMARLFGLGTLTGIEIGTESKGLVPDPAWKEQVLKERWYLGNTYHVGIGQGDLLVTPIQIAKLIQALGHSGVACQPTIFQTKEHNCSSLGITSEHLETVLRGMLDACSPSGTAFPFFPRNGALRSENAGVYADLQKGAVACKTGTAEFGGANEQGYRNTHGWFVAIVEPKIKTENQTPVMENQATEASSSAQIALEGELRQQWLAQIEKTGFPTRISIVVLVESDEDNSYKEGSRDAGPIAKTIVDWIEGN